MYLPNIKSAFFITISLLLISSFTYAKTPLNITTIENWIESQAALKNWGKVHNEVLSASEKTPEEVQNPMKMTVESIVQPLVSAGLYDSANKLIQRHRFSNLEEWAKITIRITTAAAAIEFENKPNAMNTTELEELQNSPLISPEQKALITQAINQNKAMVKQLIENTNKEDKQAIKPFLKRIHSLMSEPY